MTIRHARCAASIGKAATQHSGERDRAQSGEAYGSTRRQYNPIRSGAWTLPRID
jgi:hypothetical protein